MKQRISFLIIIILLLSCDNYKKNIVYGKLNPNIVSLIDFQNASETEINDFVKRIDSLSIKLNDKDLAISSKYYHNLLRYNMIRMNSITLNLEDKKLFVVFLNKKQYQKIRKFDHLKTNIKNEVFIKLKYRKIDEYIFVCDSIIDVTANY